MDSQTPQSEHEPATDTQDLGIGNTLDVELFSKTALESGFDIMDVVQTSQCNFQSEVEDSLLSQVGSRRFCWMVFLGLIPCDGTLLQ